MTIDDLKKICAAATPGPWEWETANRLYAGNGYVIEEGDVDAMAKENADFIAAFNPELVAKLLEVVEASKEVVSTDLAGYPEQHLLAALAALEAT